MTDVTNKSTDNSSPRARLVELSYMNVAFTFAVILIHALSEPVTSLDRASMSYFAVYAPWKLLQFVTQAFVFLSGVKLFVGQKSIERVGHFYLARSKRVYVPYVIWVIIYYAYFVLIKWYSFSIKDLLGYIVFGDLASHFYFVVIIMQLYILTPLFKVLFEKCSPWVCSVYALFVSLIFGEHLGQILSTAVSGLELRYNDRLFTTYVFYFVIGAAVGMNYDRVISALERARGLVYTAFFFFAALNLTLSYLASCGRIYISFAYTMHFAYSVSAIAASLTFSRALARKRAKIPRIVEMIDRSSYMLYLSHILVIFALRYFIVDHLSTDIGKRLVLTLAILAIYIFASVGIWSCVKEKTRRTRT